jgi:hypothetical protein
MNYNGITTEQVNEVKQAIETFLKVEYTEGLRNEFNTTESLINKLKTDTITGKKRVKSFALGVTDNVRALGRTNDTYKLETTDYSKGVNTVEAGFDTTKFMAEFSITDEVILKGTTDGSIFDVVKDSLERMKLSLRHTQNRYIYGSKTGLIGKVVANSTIAVTDGTPYVTMKVTNSQSLLPGMGIQIQWNTTGPDTLHSVQGIIWQKDNSIIHDERLIIILENTKETGDIDNAAVIPADANVYGKQLLLNGQIAQEYTGLQDIIFTKDNTIFEVNRAVYKSFNPTIYDLQGELLTEGILRDMTDHLALTSPQGTSIDMVASNHRIIASIEKQLYQFKQYNMDTTANGFQLGGRPEIKFDTYQLHKDKYSRDRNVGIMDTRMIGELRRKDFDWITNGREGVLERINGTEIYEGIMTKYADMYIEGWKSQAGFINARETVEE